MPNRGAGITQEPGRSRKVRPDALQHVRIVPCCYIAHHLLHLYLSRVPRCAGDGDAPPVKANQGEKISKWPEPARDADPMAVK